MKLSVASLLLLTAFCVASGERLDYEAACKQFRVESGDLSFLAEVQYVTVGNNRFAFRRISLRAPADATPLLLLMGYGGTMNDWGPTLLRRLAEKQDVIIFDNVAQGLSKEIEPTEGPITPAILEEATLDFLDALNLTRPHVAGWSLGACAALKLAALHPERVSKVVSWGGTSPDGRAVTGSLPTMKRLFNPNNTDEDYAPLNWDLSSPSGLKGACFWMSDKRRMPPNDARPEVNERYSQGIWRAIRPWDWSSWLALGRTQVPVLLMTGTEDIVVPAKAATKLAGQIPGAWLAQFPGTGHGFIWERMDEVLAVMEAFLQAGSAEGQAAGGAEGHAAGSAEGHAAGSSGGGEAGQGGSADGEL